jgi:23S rRNA (uracil1939-C5)-methyltransferase
VGKRAFEDQEGTVEDLARHGDGVVKTAVGHVLAPGVLPGERVRLSGIAKRSGTLRADRAEVLDPSSQRVDPPCSLVGRCGGCPLMIASAPMEARFKRTLIESALSAIPGAEDAGLTFHDARDANLAYRTRARLAWARTGRGLRLGYREPRKHSLAAVRTCAVLAPVLDQALAFTHRELGRHLAGEGEVHLCFGAGGRAVIALASDAAQPPELYGALEALVAGGRIAGAALRAGGASVDVTWGDPREHRTGADGRPLLGAVRGFSQAHEAMNQVLVDGVMELAEATDRRVLELFSGSGNLTVMLARVARSVVAVEVHAPAAEACRANLAARGLEAAVRTDDAETYRPPQQVDLVVLDPPRTGAPGAVTRILHARPEAIVYVSCDPPTLSRDLKRLAQDGGYRVTRALGVNLFPQTAHVETVVRMERA